jgi:hypothetical protein
LRDQSERIESGRRRWRRAFRATIALVIAAGVIEFRRPLFSGNFGVVDPGRVYRCAQPTANLGRILESCHPASILNLRGGKPSDDWYAAEVRETSERHIDFYDLPLSPVRRPRRNELLDLLAVLERCRYPLLIHCKSGADRTGLATALYLMARLGEPPARALDAFSLAYAHIPIGGPEHLHEPLLEYDAWLKARGVSHTPGRFRWWVERDYRADDPLLGQHEVRAGPRMQARAGNRPRR